MTDYRQQHEQQSPLEMGGESRNEGCNRVLGIVVGEYCVTGQVSGGLDAVAEFVWKSFADVDGWAVRLASPRMSSRAQESQRLLAPRSWTGPRVRVSIVQGKRVTYFGACFAEIEASRYAPRKRLTEFLDACDAVLIVAGSPAIINAARRTGKPIIAQVATFVEDERVSRLAAFRGLRRLLELLNLRIVRRLDEAGIRRADAVLVENVGMVARVERWSDNVHLIAPGVDCEQFTPTARDGIDRYVLSVGRWEDPRKDLGTLLHAFRHALDIGARSHRLVLAGPHAPTREQQKLISSLRLQDHVEVQVMVPPVALAALYQGADLFALTSTEEGLGLVFLESMASGTPVLATETEGAKYALGNSGAGQLVALGDGIVGRFGDALAKWLGDEDLRERASAAARINAVDRFDSRTAGARFRHVVEQCLKNESLVNRARRDS